MGDRGLAEFIPTKIRNEKPKKEFPVEPKEAVEAVETSGGKLRELKDAVTYYGEFENIK
jgi:hypothetical protein